MIKTTNNLSVTRKNAHFHITKQQAKITKQKPKFCAERDENSIFWFLSKYPIRLCLALLLSIGAMTPVIRGPSVEVISLERISWV